MSAPVMHGDQPVWGLGYGRRRHLVVNREDHGAWKSADGLCATPDNPVRLDKFSDDETAGHAEDVMRLDECKRCGWAAEKTAKAAKAIS